MQAHDRSTSERLEIVRILTSYSMGGAVTASLQDRIKSLEKPLQEYLAALHGRIYFGELRARELRAKRDELIKQMAELDVVKRVTSPDFNLMDWIHKRGSWKTDP